MCIAHSGTLNAGYGHYVLVQTIMTFVPFD
jgi:hypothetical protein